MHTVRNRRAAAPAGAILSPLPADAAPPFLLREAPLRRAAAKPATKPASKKDRAAKARQVRKKAKAARIANARRAQPRAGTAAVIALPPLGAGGRALVPYRGDGLFVQLADWLGSRLYAGWRRLARPAPTPAPDTAELARLAAENRALRRQIEALMALREVSARH